MSAPINRQIVLAARPVGNPTESDLRVVEREVPVPGDGEILIRNLFISLDPYNRIMMGNANSDAVAIDIGQTMTGATVAVVEESKNADFAVGDHVVSMLSGWQEYAVSGGWDLRKIDPEQAPPSVSLGVLGHTGLTAWVGLTEIVDPKPGGTLVVTAAAGAVGSAAVQIGRLRGHRVVGVAGGQEKSRYLLDVLGVDAAVDYKATDFAEQLARAVPDGIDTVFENVGAFMLEALLPHLNLNAQIVVSGIMSQITATVPPAGPDRVPDLLRAVLYQTLTIRGFALPDYLGSFPKFIAEVGPWVADGRVKYTEDIVDGFEAIPSAFIKIFEGRALGKVIAKIA